MYFIQLEGTHDQLNMEFDAYEMNFYTKHNLNIYIVR